jgi:YD repeat-containing protein
MALAGSLNVVPVHASFISVSVTFTNNGKLPLQDRFQVLNHGCWNPEPPRTIAPLTTVTWKSESCGIGTGTEGSVQYQPYGAPDNIRGNFYWDDPTIGSNSATDSAPSGCTSSHQGPPSSGNNVSVSFTMGCSDSSGDGIADVWKLNGASFDPGGGVGFQFIDLPNMGAAVGKKDTFMQIDWMQGNQSGQFNQKLTATAIRTMVNTYAANGYILHVDEGSDSVLNFATNTTWGSLSKAQSVAYQANLGTATVDASGNVTSYDWTAYNNIKATTFTPTGRSQIFHHVLAAHQLANLGNSGISQTPGTDLIISLGTFTSGVGSDNEQLATLMHEFGHNLGLGHGGGDGVNYKPNYFSVMNYAFQFSGITKNGTTTFDYSHTADTQLVEINPPGLNEASGVPSAPGVSTVHYCPAQGGNPAVRLTVANAAGPIDWDCDGVIQVNIVSADINGDPAQPPNTLGTLTGYDDWSHLNLNVGGIGSFGAAVPVPPLQTILDDPTPQMVREILPVDTTPPVTTAAAAPTANAAGWNNTNVTVTLSATDDASGVARIEFNLDGVGWMHYTTPVVISTEGVHTFQYRSIDRSSNVETPNSLIIRIDKTPPTVTYTGNLGTYNILGTVNITCTALDNLSGVASTTCQNIMGPAYNYNPGSNTFSAAATDNAGNIGFGSTSFTLVVTFDDMCTLSERFVTNQGVAMSNDMCAQLDAAQRAEARDNLRAETQSIAAYINDVNAAVNGGFLSPTNAAILIKLAGGL